MRFFVIFNALFLSAIFGLHAQPAAKVAGTHSCAELLNVLEKAANSNSESGQAIQDITRSLKKLDQDATSENSPKEAFNEMKLAYERVRPHFYSYDPLTRRTILRFLIKGLNSDLIELSNFSMDELMQIHSEALDRLKSQKWKSNINAYEDSPAFRVVRLLAEAGFPAATEAWKKIQANEELPLVLFSTRYSEPGQAKQLP